MLDLAILGLLEERELHGYEIRRQLRDSLGLLANVSFGSLYPALARLEAAGAVEAAESPGAPEQAPAPPTGSLSGERAVLRAHRLGGTRGRARPQGVPDHRHRPPDVRRAAGRGRRRRRRPELRAAAGLRPPPGTPGPPRPAGAPTGPAPAAARRGAGGRRAIRRSTSTPARWWSTRPKPWPRTSVGWTASSTPSGRGRPSARPAPARRSPNPRTARRSPSGRWPAPSHR